MEGIKENSRKRFCCQLTPSVEAHLVGNVEAQKSTNDGQGVLNDNAALNAVLSSDNVKDLLKSAREGDNLLQVGVAGQHGWKEEESLIPQHLTGATTHHCTLGAWGRCLGIQNGEYAINAWWWR